jgi:hypothetical protein
MVLFKPPSCLPEDRVSGCLWDRETGGVKVGKGKKVKEGVVNVSLRMRKQTS